jgi:hypothetical protein
MNMLLPTWSSFPISTPFDSIATRQCQKLEANYKSAQKERLAKTPKVSFLWVFGALFIAFRCPKKVEKGTAKKNNQLISENYATIRLSIFNAALHP